MSTASVSTWRQHSPGRRGLRPGVGLLRSRLAGPGGRPGEAVRRTVGRRADRQLRPGRFPPLWREWNGKYRDTMRDFWRSRDGLLGDFAERLTGSADLFAGRGRRPTASVNLITVHDGFTLTDLVSYDSKHNEANGEGNRDGSDDNRSWNCGVEGPTSDPDALLLRARQRRAMLTTLLLSFGIPLLLGGDELGRTQQGNNNAYCQDNPITWFDWSRRGRGPPRVHEAADRTESGTPGLPTPALPGGRRGCRAELVHARRRGHDPGRLVRPEPRAASSSTWTAPTIPTVPRTAVSLSTTTSSSWSTPGGSPSRSSSRRPAPARGGTKSSIPPTPTPHSHRARSPPARRSPSAPGP